MKITIEEVASKYKNDVVRVGGNCEYYINLDECFVAVFDHHEITTEGDTVVVTDELTGYEFVIDKRDFYSIKAF